MGRSLKNFLLLLSVVANGQRDDEPVAFEGIIGDVAVAHLGA